MAENGGLFINRAGGRHAERVIASYEILFVRSGRLRMYEGSREFAVEPGQALILRPGRRHGGSADYEPDAAFWWVHFRLPATARHKSATTLRVPQQVAVARPDRLTELCHRFVDEQEARTLSPAEASLWVQLMLCELARPQPRARAAPAYAQVIASRATAKIDASMNDRRLSTAALAEALQLNADYLNRAFKQAKGTTVTEQIHARRLKLARDLLRETLLSAKQIAHRCGFSNAGYFRRVFKRSEGVTPVTYRRRFMRVHINTR